MPRYFFHFVDDQVLADSDGQELPDEASARLEAETLAYELAGEYGPAAIIVTKEEADGEAVFSITIPAEFRLH